MRQNKAACFKMLPKRPETAKNGRKKVKDVFLYRLSSTKMQTKRIPQVCRITQLKIKITEILHEKLPNTALPPRLNVNPFLRGGGVGLL